MKTNIKIKLNEKDDFYSKFSDKKLSQDLSEYIIEECYGEPIDNEVIINIEAKKKIKESEQEEMKDILRKNFLSNIKDEEYFLNREYSKDIALFGLGIILFILYYAFFKHIEIFSDIVVIVSWLSIWESISSLIFNNFSIRVKIKRLKKIYKAEIKFLS